MLRRTGSAALLLLAISQACFGQTKCKNGAVDLWAKRLAAQLPAGEFEEVRKSQTLLWGRPDAPGPVASVRPFCSRGLVCCVWSSRSPDAAAGEYVCDVAPNCCDFEEIEDGTCRGGDGKSVARRSDTSSDESNDKSSGSSIGLGLGAGLGTAAVLGVVFACVLRYFGVPGFRRGANGTTGDGGEAVGGGGSTKGLDAPQGTMGGSALAPLPAHVPPAISGGAAPAQALAMSASSASSAEPSSEPASVQDSGLGQVCGGSEVDDTSLPV